MSIYDATFALIDALDEAKIPANHASRDRGYLSHWCDELNIRELFAQLWSEAQELE